MTSKSIEFFDAQFKRQVEAKEFKLNPFEVRALEFLEGTVLDFGCGLGNLSIEAARRGHTVTAVDACPTAIAYLERVALAEDLPLNAHVSDAMAWEPGDDYTTIVSIGLLMFLPRERALYLLRVMQEHVEPGGRAVINVLTEGTTFMGMFDPGSFYLFGSEELSESFKRWKTLLFARESFPAPGDTVKQFVTLVAEKPAI